MSNEKYIINSDDRTVWVNNATCCIGRFGKNGIDIHRDASDQTDLGECLYCTHAETTREDWDVFVSKMEELHGVVVPGKFKPARFRDSATKCPT